jgi:hypothetical protein
MFPSNGSPVERSSSNGSTDIASKKAAMTSLGLALCSTTFDRPRTAACERVGAATVRLAIIRCGAASYVAYMDGGHRHLFDVESLVELMRHRLLAGVEASSG